MKEIEKTKNKKISSSSDNRIIVNNFTAVIGVIKEIIMTSNAFGISPIVTLIPNRKYKREMTTILVDIPATPYHHTITIGSINVSPTDALLSILSSIPKGENIKPPKWTYDFLEEYYNKKLKKKRKERSHSNQKRNQYLMKSDY